MKGFDKRPRVDVAPGERVLAWTEATTGEVLAGTREAGAQTWLSLPTKSVGVAAKQAS